MFKNMRLVILFDMLLNTSFKMKTSFAKKDNKSHNFRHPHSTARCFDSYNFLCFKIIHKSNSTFHLKIKQALYVNWRKANLNVQQNYLALTLSL